MGSPDAVLIHLRVGAWSPTSELEVARPQNRFICIATVADAAADADADSDADAVLIYLRAGAWSPMSELEVA